jgi:hypothetical protein
LRMLWEKKDRNLIKMEISCCQKKKEWLSLQEILKRIC